MMLLKFKTELMTLLSSRFLYVHYIHVWKYLQKNTNIIMF